MIQTEYDLFNYLRNIVPDLTASPNPYSVYDCWSKRFNMYVELKCRRTHYDKLLIEYTKYQRLVTTAFLGRYVPYYVCSTPNGVFAFNLINHSPEWVSELMPYHLLKLDKALHSAGSVSGFRGQAERPEGRTLA